MVTPSLSNMELVAVSYCGRNMGVVQQRSDATFIVSLRPIA